MQRYSNNTFTRVALRYEYHSMIISLVFQSSSLKKFFVFYFVQYHYTYLLARETSIFREVNDVYTLHSWGIALLLVLPVWQLFFSYVCMYVCMCMLIRATFLESYQ